MAPAASDDVSPMLREWLESFRLVGDGKSTVLRALVSGPLHKALAHERHLQANVEAGRAVLEARGEPRGQAALCVERYVQVKTEALEHLNGTLSIPKKLAAAVLQAMPSDFADCLLSTPDIRALFAQVASEARSVTVPGSDGAVQLVRAHL
jgi:hypothetical protein